LVSNKTGSQYKELRFKYSNVSTIGNQRMEKDKRESNLTSVTDRIAQSANSVME